MNIRSQKCICFAYPLECNSGMLFIWLKETPTLEPPLGKLSIMLQNASLCSEMLIGFPFVYFYIMAFALQRVLIIMFITFFFDLEMIFGKHWLGFSSECITLCCHTGASASNGLVQECESWVGSRHSTHATSPFPFLLGCLSSFSLPLCCSAFSFFSWICVRKGFHANVTDLKARMTKRHWIVTISLLTLSPMMHLSFENSGPS